MKWYIIIAAEVCVIITLVIAISRLTPQPRVADAYKINQQEQRKLYNSRVVFAVMDIQDYNGIHEM